MADQNNQTGHFSSTNLQKLVEEKTHQLVLDSTGNFAMYRFIGADPNKGNEESEEETTEVEESDEDKYINLKLEDVDDKEISFQVKMTSEMGKLKKSYAERLGVPMTSLRFMFDGRTINDDETPKELEMENDDVISVFQEEPGEAMEYRWTSEDYSNS